MSSGRVRSHATASTRGGKTSWPDTRAPNHSFRVAYLGVFSEYCSSPATVNVVERIREGIGEIPKCNESVRLATSRKNECGGGLARRVPFGTGVLSVQIQTCRFLPQFPKVIERIEGIGNRTQTLVRVIRVDTVAHALDPSIHTVPPSSQCEFISGRLHALTIDNFERGYRPLAAAPVNPSR